MFTDDGPIEIECDSPPYYIVETCHRIGLKRAEDVRWCRLSDFVKGHPTHKSLRWASLFDRRAWKRLFLGGIGQTCNCGSHLPALDHYKFTLAPHNRQVSYLLGQCRLCLSIYWDDVPA